MAEAPEQEASARVAQTLAVAVQVAEVAIRLQAQRTERAAAGQAQQAGAARADRLARHAAARVQWSRALDPGWVAGAELPELGRAWGAAAGWADTDPTAEVAAARVEARMAQTAPTAMDRFHRLRAAGSTRVEAMRAVLADVAAEASSRARVFVAEPGQAPTPGATRNAGGAPALRVAPGVGACPGSATNTRARRLASAATSARTARIASTRVLPAARSRWKRSIAVGAVCAIRASTRAAATSAVGSVSAQPAAAPQARPSSASSAPASQPGSSARDHCTRAAATLVVGRVRLQGRRVDGRWVAEANLPRSASW